MKNSNPIISSDLESDESEDRSDPGSELELRPLVFGAAQHGQRLDLALVELVSEFSRSYLQQLIDGGSLTLLTGGESHLKRTMIRELEQENGLLKNIPIYLSRYGLRVWQQEGEREPLWYALV